MNKYIEQFKDNIFDGIFSVRSKKIQYVDFFAGCGGMSYGFHQAGMLTGKMKNVGAFDFDKNANLTFSKNFGFAPTEIDIGNSSVQDIKILMKKNDYDEKLPLIVIGCAPCQGFSSHRKKDNRLDKRNSLVGKFAEIAVGLNADFIVMENVPDLLAKKHQHHFDEFRSILDKNGYKLSVKILNMSEYGVPQARFRTVALASKSYFPSMPPCVKKVGQQYTVRDAIGHLPNLTVGQVTLGDSMHITSRHRPETIEILKKVPINGGSRPAGVGPVCLDRVAGFYDVYGRLAWDKPSITITARCRTPSCGRFAHPDQNRGLSVREAALLQGFPPDFVFEGPFDDKYKQIGNAVPPLFSKVLARHVIGLMVGKVKPLVDESFLDYGTFDSYSSIIAHVKNRGFKSGSLSIP